MWRGGRKTNAFEKILLAIGITLIIMGFAAINRLFSVERVFSWELLQTTFLWLMMILLLILAAVNENMKEELKIIILQQHDEIKLLRKDLMSKRKLI